MKKAVKYTSLLTLQIILLGLIGIFGTFLSDYLVSINWFGDYVGIDYFTNKKELMYGSRHYWYNWVISVLFIVQVGRIIIWSIHYWDDEINK